MTLLPQVLRRYPTSSHWTMSGCIALDKDTRATPSLTQTYSLDLLEKNVSTISDKSCSDKPKKQRKTFSEWRRCLFKTVLSRKVSASKHSFLKVENVVSKAIEEDLRISLFWVCSFTSSSSGNEESGTTVKSVSTSQSVSGTAFSDTKNLFFTEWTFLPL